jgi:hypothetical protein
MNPGLFTDRDLGCMPFYHRCAKMGFEEGRKNTFSAIMCQGKAGMFVLFFHADLRSLCSSVRSFALHKRGEPKGGTKKEKIQTSTKQKKILAKKRHTRGKMKSVLNEFGFPFSKQIQFHFQIFCWPLQKNSCIARLFQSL